MRVLMMNVLTFREVLEGRENTKAVVELLLLA